jgi:hypothetical protein
VNQDGWRAGLRLESALDVAKLHRHAGWCRQAEKLAHRRGLTLLFDS